jgi:hypothetical protein
MVIDEIKSQRWFCKWPRQRRRKVRDLRREDEAVPLIIRHWIYGQRTFAALRFMFFVPEVPHFFGAARTKHKLLC